MLKTLQCVNSWTLLSLPLHGGLKPDICHLRHRFKIFPAGVEKIRKTAKSLVYQKCLAVYISDHRGLTFSDLMMRGCKKMTNVMYGWSLVLVHCNALGGPEGVQIVQW